MKSKKSATPVAPATTESEIHVLKTGSCPSLSGKSKLTYHVGRNEKGEIQFRIHANSSTGYFNDDWVSLSAIQQAFDKIPKNKTLTSYALSSLFRGKSTNTPAFVFAALKQEGLVQASKDKQRTYERLDPKAYMAGLKTQKAETKPAEEGKKTPSKSTKKKKA